MLDSMAADLVHLYQFCNTNQRFLRSSARGARYGSLIYCTTDQNAADIAQDLLCTPNYPLPPLGPNIYPPGTAGAHLANLWYYCKYGLRCSCASLHPNSRPRCNDPNNRWDISSICFQECVCTNYSDSENSFEFGTDSESSTASNDMNTDSGSSASSDGNTYPKPPRPDHMSAARARLLKGQGSEMSVTNAQNHRTT